MKRIIPFTLGGLLAAARSQKHVTLRQVAGATGISNACISQLEHDRKDASFSTVVKLCDYYAIRIDTAARIFQMTGRNDTHEKEDRGIEPDGAGS